MPSADPVRIADSDTEVFRGRTYPSSSLLRLVVHLGSVAALCRQLSGDISAQAIQKWVNEGHAPEKRIPDLVPLLPPGITAADLVEDRARSTRRRLASRSPESSPADAAIKDRSALSDMPAETVLAMLRVALVAKLPDAQFRELATRLLS